MEETEPLVVLLFAGAPLVPPPLAAAGLQAVQKRAK